MIAKIISEEDLNNISCKYYGGGHELKAGDKIYIGYVINYSRLDNRGPIGQYDPNEIYSSMKLFVEYNNALYELYTKSK